MSDDGVVIRRVETQAEYEECVRIQDETWGAGFSERVPAAILKVGQYIGGVTAAAFDRSGENRSMLGFVFGMTGVRDGQLVHWSDMLAVRPKARNHGVGRRLKLYQRELVAELGVTQILWTFDPLVARNAHLNLNSLGARVTDYVSDMYGADTGSALHQGIGTDRFVVTWEIGGNEAGPHGPVHGPASGDATKHDAAGPHGPARGDDIIVAIPGDIQELIATAPETARGWRETTRAAFLTHMRDGYRVTGFDRAGTSGYYRLSRAAD
jgi:predicted GNAT superfamily acetyltransferase